MPEELEKKAEKPTEKGKPKKFSFKLGDALVELLAIAFWLYVPIKLFIFDIDNYLFDKFLPQYDWLLRFKFLFLISLFAIALILIRKFIIPPSLYILFYPFIMLFWKIPYFIFKQRSWVLAFALINSVISFFQSFKVNFIIFSTLIVSIAATLFLPNSALLWLSIFAMLAVLSVLFVRRFILIFQPSIVFRTYLNVFPGIRKFMSDNYSLDESIKNTPLESLDQKQMEKWTTNLQVSVLHNRICFFVSKRLKDYQSSKLNFLSYIFNLLTLTIITITAFAAINLALYKINPSFFSYIQTPNFFSFFYYSFTNLLHGSTYISPSLPISQSIYMLEVFFEFILVALLVSLFFSVRNEKYTKELDRVVEGLGEQGKDMEVFIREEYKINSIQDAIETLAEAKAGLIGIIYSITKNIE